MSEPPIPAIPSKPAPIPYASPAPDEPLTEADFLQQVRRHHWWNFGVHWLEGALAVFGLGTMTGNILPAFMLTFTSSKVLIALAVNLYYAAWSFTQFFYLPLVRRHRLRKWIVVWWGLPIRLPLVILAITAWVIGSAPPGLREQIGIGGVFLALTIHMIFAGPVELAWLDLISRVIAPERRGFYMGFRHWVEVLAQVGSACMVGHMIGSPPGTADFGWPFMIGAFAFLASMPVIAATREVPPHARPPEPKLGYWRSQRQTVRTLLADRPFRRFLWVRAAIGLLAFFSFDMFAPYLFESFAVTKQTLIVQMTITRVVCSLLAALVCGRLIDRLGCQKVLAAALIGSAVVRGLGLSLPLWPLSLAQGLGSYLVFALMGIVDAAFVTSSFVITFEFAGVHKRTAYIALTTLVFPPVSMLAAGLGGMLIDAAGYGPTLAIATAMALAAALLVVFCLPEPRKHLMVEKLIVADGGKI